MSIKVFQTNKAGKIEFTRCELEKLLNETYKEGYNDGECHAKRDYWTWTSPSVYPTPRLNDIVYCSSDDSNTATSTATISTATSDNTTLTSNKTNTTNATNATGAYEVKAPFGGDLSTLSSVIEDFLSKDADSMFLHPSLNGTKRAVEKEPFANLKKELKEL